MFLLAINNFGYGIKMGSNAGSSGNYNKLHTCLTLPALAKVKFEAKKDIQIFGVAGPFLNVFFEKNAYISKTANFGLNFGGGVEYKRLIFSLGYDLGLTSANDYNSIQTKVHAFKISVGYKL